MQKIKILIVEDEPIIAAHLQRDLKKMDFEITDSVESGEEALESVKSNPPDLILMDIQLEGDLDGIDTAHHISKDRAIPIIYLTSNTDERTFNRAKLTQPHAFLSKPFRLPDIKYSIDLAFAEKNPSQEAVENQEEETIAYQMKDCIFVKAKEHLVKIKLADIRYVEADSCYCKIVTTEGKYVIVSTLKKFEASVTFPSLLRVHRSYIVNLDFIEKIGDSEIIIGNKSIAIGRSYREAFYRRIPKF